MKLTLEIGSVSLLEIKHKTKQQTNTQANKCALSLVLSDNTKMLHGGCDKCHFYRSVWKKISSMPDDSSKNLDFVPGGGVRTVKVRMWNWLQP